MSAPEPWPFIQDPESMTPEERANLLAIWKSERSYSSPVFIPPDPRDRIVDSVANLAKASILNTIVLILLVVVVLLQWVTR